MSCDHKTPSRTAFTPAITSWGTQGKHLADSDLTSVLWQANYLTGKAPDA